MPSSNDALSWKGLDVYGRDGEKIGKITDVYLDGPSHQPSWLAVKTGLLSRRRSIVPVADACLDEAHVHRDADYVAVPFAKAVVEGSPQPDGHGELSADDERRLRQHYSGIALGG